MEQKPQTPPNQTDREFIFRIVVCAVAVLALSAAITLMVRSIVLDANATKRLMAEAFMSYQSEEQATPDESNVVEAPATTPKPITPQTTAQVPETTEETIDLVSASLSQNKATIHNYTSYSIDETALLNHKFEFYGGTNSPLVLILHSHITECYAPSGASAVKASFNFESNKSNENIFAVGEAIAEEIIINNRRTNKCRGQEKAA